MKIQIDIKRAKALYQDGRSLDYIANELGVSWGTVRKRLLGAGIKLRKASATAISQERARQFWLKVRKNGPTPKAKDFKQHPMSAGWEYIEETDSFIWAAGPCWIWTGTKNDKGYGQFVVDGKQVLAHRFAFCNFHKTDLKSLKGWHLIHGCDNPPCVNPNHVNPANRNQNFWDRAIKGRAKHSAETKRRIGKANAIALLGKKQPKSQIEKRSESLRRAHASGKFKSDRKDISTEQIILSYAKLKSMPKVADELGVSIPTVHRRLLKAGVQVNPRGTNQFSAKQHELSLA